MEASTTRVTAKMKSVMESLRNIRKEEKEENARRREEEARKKKEATFYKRALTQIKKCDADPSETLNNTVDWRRFQYSRERDKRTVSIKLVLPSEVTVPVEIRRMHQAICEMTNSNDISSGNRMQVSIDNGTTELETDFDSLTFKDGKDNWSYWKYNKYGAVDKDNGNALLGMLKLDKAKLETQVEETMRKSFLDGKIRLSKDIDDKPTIIIGDIGFTLASNPPTSITLCLTNKQQCSPSQRDFTLFDSDDHDPLTVNSLVLRMKLSPGTDPGFVAGLAKIFYEGSGFDENAKYFPIHGKEVEKPVSISINDGATNYTLVHGVAKGRYDFEQLHMPSLGITSSVPIRTENVERLFNALLRTS